MKTGNLSFSVFFCNRQSNGLYNTSKNGVAHITQPIANFYFVCGTSHTPQPIANFYFVCGTSYTPQPITIFCVWDESHTTANNNFVFVCGTQSHTTANYNFPFCVWDAVTHHSQLQYFVCGTSHTPHVA